MSAPLPGAGDHAPLTARERRLLLWLAVGAISWRWVTAQRTPMPGVDGCHDLWLAAELAQGHVGAFATAWWHGLWALLLAPFLAAGLPPFFTAHLLAAIVGGLVVWPVAAAAQRLREGAGVPAAVLAAVAAGPVLAAGAGAPTALTCLVVAMASLAVARARPVVALLLLLTAALAGADAVRVDPGTLWTQWRVGLGPMLLLWPVAWLPPRPPRARWLHFVALLVITIAVATGTVAALAPAWTPLLAVLGGVGLARLAGRWRDLLLCVVVGVDFLSAWQRVEPAAAAEERWLGRYLAHEHGGRGELVSDLPRVAWAFGSRPLPYTMAQLLTVAAREDTVLLVLGPGIVDRATAITTLGATFGRCRLSVDGDEAAATIGATVLLRRP
ncbi:MAG: hypothetical protein JNN13_03410 [Planctomycetes bacterium]|nr:hypothetical protein [Planctomycetota bacterium]